MKVLALLGLLLLASPAFADHYSNITEADVLNFALNLVSACKRPQRAGRGGAGAGPSCVTVRCSGRPNHNRSPPGRQGSECAV